MDIQRYKPLTDAFLAWYNQQPDRENHYGNQITFQHLNSLNKKEFIRFFYDFYAEGGNVQSGGNRTKNLFKESLTNNFPAFKEYLLQPFRDDFSAADWLMKRKDFYYWGEGISTIYLNRIDPDKYPVINNKTLDGLKLLGWKIRGSYPAKLEDVRVAQRSLIEAFPDLKNFYKIDLLNQFIVAEPEGQEMISRINPEIFLESQKQKDDPVSRIIVAYKQQLAEQGFGLESYKWVAVKHFTETWNPESPDFGQMLEEAFSKQQNLIDYRPLRVLNALCQENPPELRSIFLELYDEAVPLASRISSFKDQMAQLVRILSKGDNDFQDERTISLYLFFRYPEKYIHYKDSYYSTLIKYTGQKKAKAGEKLIPFQQIASQFRDKYLTSDEELTGLVQSILPDDVYQDPQFNLLTQDVLFFMEHYREALPVAAEDPIPLMDTEQNDYGPRFWLWSPDSGAGMWDEFHQSGLMGIGWDALGDLQQYHDKREIIHKLQSLEGDDKTRMNAGLACYEFLAVIKPGDIIIPKRGRSTYLGYGIVRSDYFHEPSRSRLSHLRRVDWKKRGEFEETKGPIVLKTLTDITKYPEYVKKLISLIGIDNVEYGAERKYLIEGSLNKILFGPPGTGKTYETIDLAVATINGFDSPDHRSNKAAFDRLRSEGQIEFITFHQNYSYEDFVVGLRPDPDHDELRFKPHKGIFYEICRRARENYESYIHGTGRLRSFEEALQEFMQPLELGQEIPVEMAYGKVFYITDSNDRCISFRKPSGSSSHTLSINTLKDILEGTREMTSGLVSYYIPLVKELKKRRLTGSIGESLRKFVLIIDEINRANISRVFGELITLIEEDKRIGQENELLVTLPNGERNFGVPPNLYLIGTMNTADKSIALLDIALRRRFEFIGKYPDLEKLEEPVRSRVERLNAVILETKKSADFMIGHAFFINRPVTDFVTIMNRKIIPLFYEYFNGRSDFVGEILKKAGIPAAKDSVTHLWVATEA